MKINKRIHSLLALSIQVLCLIGIVLILSASSPIGGQGMPRLATPFAHLIEAEANNIGGQFATRNSVYNEKQRFCCHSENGGQRVPGAYIPLGYIKYNPNVSAVLA